ITFCLLASAVASNANLIVNGSFENPNLGGGWALYNNIPGWSAVGAYPIEIGAGGVYGDSGYDQQQVMEQDTTGNAMVDQILATPGGSYNLSFLYADRLSVAPPSATFDVYWNGNLVQSFSPTSTVMSLYTTTVTALANNTLEFRGTGIQDSYGAIIDNVQLNAPVPDGGLTAALLGMGLSSLGWARRAFKGYKIPVGFYGLSSCS
ncbi:MAG TPA: hypothetical protein VLT36_14840, partial [Candidatus Dormibacteraeota bacterium]|nr:hypothetical protein [Candidatus Dormibacteraeota bacterium]